VFSFDWFCLACLSYKKRKTVITINFFVQDVQRFSIQVHLLIKKIMKKIAYSIFAAIFFIAVTQKVSAQSEQTRQVSGFNSLGSAGPFNVHVNIDGTESLKIKADKTIIDEIETFVEEGELKIRFKHRDQWNRDNDNHGPIDVYVTAKSLSGLANAGSGSIKVDGTVSGDHVRVSISGSGSISTPIKSEELQVSISGSGSIHLQGGTNEATIAIAGSGGLMAKELKIGKASVRIAGSGNAYFAAEKTISTHIAGSGNVVYSGSASISDSRTAGSGRVSRED
jgi:hypothetical protein